MQVENLPEQAMTYLESPYNGSKEKRVQASFTTRLERNQETREKGQDLEEMGSINDVTNSLKRPFARAMHHQDARQSIFRENENHRGKNRIP